ncbi:MAG TPA: hypothetical protein VHD56_20040 [Tepidisphaeraceae bacterium]|nr:hypothetical protein [Tepidisphaeraceae bacterium]
MTITIAGAARNLAHLYADLDSPNVAMLKTAALSSIMLTAVLGFIVADEVNTLSRKVIPFAQPNSTRQPRKKVTALAMEALVCKAVTRRFSNVMIIRLLPDYPKQDKIQMYILLDGIVTFEKKIDMSCGRVT